MCAGRIRSVISARVFAAFIGGAVLFAFPASATTVTDPNILKGSVSGETLTIQGTNLGTNKPTVQLGGAGLTVQSFSPTQVVATMPPGGLPPGTYQLLFTRANGATTVLDLTIGAVGKDGAPGAPGAPGTSVTVAALPTGDSHCPNGGASFTDGSGSVAYACTGGAEPVCTRGGMCIGTNNACAYDKDCAATNYGGACQWTQASARFVDNGNGTVTDRRTCLTWEKKRGTVDPLERYSYCPGGRTCSDPRNVNNIYSWSVGAPWSFDGSVLTDFLKKLNDEAFAGHTDWRIPTSAGANTRETGSDPELESIILSWESSCSPPCIDPIFGPTLAYFYWSSSIDGESPPRAWAVDFANMMVIDETRNEIYPVRAVRGGP